MPNPTFSKNLYEHQIYFHDLTKQGSSEATMLGNFFLDVLDPNWQNEDALKNLKESIEAITQTFHDYLSTTRFFVDDYNGTNFVASAEIFFRSFKREGSGEASALGAFFLDVLASNDEENPQQLVLACAQEIENNLKAIRTHFS